MKSAFCLQPSYIPWLGFWDLLIKCDVFVVMDDVKFTRRDWRNRNKIKTSAGTTWLSIPVQSKGKYDQLLSEVLIQTDQKWNEKHLKTIEMNYKKAPHFENVFELLKQSLLQPKASLVEMVMEINHKIQSYLQIDCEIVYSSTISNTSSDRQERMIELCQSVGAERCYNGAAGKKLYSPDEFKTRGIDLVFQEYKHPTYDQLWGEFIPFLSIIDLLCNYGKKSRKIICEED